MVLRIVKQASADRVFVGARINILEALDVGTTATESIALLRDAVRLCWVALASATSDLHITTDGAAATTDTLLIDRRPEVFEFPRGSQLGVICSATATTGNLGRLYITEA